MGHWKLCGYVFLVITLIRRTTGSPNDRCSFTFKDDTVLDVEKSQEKGAQVVRDIIMSDKFKCAEECCSTEGDWCTLAVFHHKKGMQNINCFLVQCVPEGSTESACVTRYLQSSGFVSAVVEHHISRPTPGLQQVKTSTISTTTLSTTTITTTTKKVSTPPNVHAVTTRGPLSTAHHDATTTIKGTSPTTPEESMSSPDSTVSIPPEFASNVTAAKSNKSVGVGTERSGNITNGSGEVNDHVDATYKKQTVTQTGILIMTLCFGLIFSLAVMVVLGKRWFEGYKRRKYSKVDYLINGIYS